MSQNHTLFLLAESPIHAGDKPEAEGDIDLPIQKDNATGFPVVRGSTVRGSLRQLSRANELEVEELFGSEPDNPDPKPGILNISDFDALLCPVRTLTGFFAWVTTPYLLQNLQRNLQLCGSAERIPIPVSGDKVLVASGSRLLSKGKISLEETVFPATESPELATLGLWIAQKALPASDTYNFLKGMAVTNIALIPDEVFQKLLPLVLPVFARIRIDPITGTVVEGALWNTEFLSSEALLCGTIIAGDDGKKSKSVEKLIELTKSRWFQIGGCKGIGMGMVTSVWL